MHVGFYQFTPRFGEVSHNLDMIVETLDQADADLIVLPELCSSGYQFVSQQEAITLSESVPDGPTTRRLIDLAQRRRMVIVAGLPERAGSACYNSAVVVGPSGFIGCYRKTHLFFEETLFFTPGDTGFQVWDIGPAKIGAMIWFDWYYPDLVLPNCPDSMPVRCLENRVFAITCNRTGSEARDGKDQLTFIGNSEVVAPLGTILHRAPRDQEELCIVEIDPADARNKAVTPYNDLLRDRRESLYR
jgi:predicted amidohydrolase